MKIKFLLILTISLSCLATGKDLKQNGFVLKNVPKNGLFHKLGLTSGDRIIKVNHKTVKNMNEAIPEFMKVKSISILRNKKLKVLKYNLGK